MHQRHRLETEVTLWLNEARRLARHALLVNLESGLFPLGVQLAEKGVLHKADLDAFYGTDPIIKESDPAFHKKLNTWTGAALQARLSPWIHRQLGRDSERLPGVPTPSKIAETSGLIADKKAAEVVKVQPRTDTPIWDGSGEFPSLGRTAVPNHRSSCMELLAATPSAG